MRKVKIRLLAFAMAGAVAGTTVLPSYPAVSVYAAGEQTQEIKWTFSGQHGEKTDSGIQLSGDGDSFGITDIEKTDNYSVKAVLTQGSEDGAVGVVLGTKNVTEPSKGSVVANVTPSNGEVRIFEFTSTGADEIGDKHYEESLKDKEQYAFEITVKGGKITVKINDTVAFEAVDLSEKASGNIGFISFKETMTVSDIEIKDITSESTDDSEDQNFKTNLDNILSTRSGDGEWKETKDGLYSNGIDKGDCFAISKTEASNFVYSTDVTFKQKTGAAALVFRANTDFDHKESYAVNLDASSHKCKFWRWQKNQDLQLIDEKEIAATEDETYTLKVVAYDSWISYYVNDVLVASTGDYTLQKDDKGQSTVLTKGYLGLLNFNGEMTFQNTYYSNLDDTNTPILDNISVSSSTGTVEKAAQFTSTEPIMIQYVKNNAEKVDLNIEKANDDTVVEIKDADGNTYVDGKNIPVKVGKNYITVTSTVKGKNDQSATLTYRVNVHRRAADKTYYNESYRDQYHYSVKDGWANDPNGLVYYNGKYHMFYQFYDDTKWGPMHWAHATSEDLIHWEEQPIAFYPDANGAMFSGCIVADENNTSGLFGEGDKGGLVALITADGNGQRIKVAYSTDEGETWTKSDKIAADWTDDPLNSQDFRDPKVFRWENKWFMVVAGGPLRIYSSENLTEWKCESTYADLHTECPDLYPIKTAESIKWVLSRGGRYYKVGDFKEVDGKWKFVADADYEDSDGVMNFGKDSYAAMTYYVQDFGTNENPTIPDIVELNWMNTWDDYCNLVADKVGQDFNGTFNLNLKLGLKQEDDKYVLTQTPIEAYEGLRDTDKKISYQDVEISQNNHLLENFTGDTYEIVANFTPSDGTTKVGFRLRSNQKGTEYTDVIYDLESEKLSIDRSKSGIIISNKFAEVDAQSKVKKNKDGSVDLHIYVDKASIEVFSSSNTVTGANQIFPTPTSLGASVIVEGEPVKANIDIYPMNSIWTEKQEVTTPQSVGSMQAANQTMYVGDTLELSAYVLPTSVDQSVEWTISSGDEIVNLKENDGNVVVEALKSGEATITATSKVDKTKKKTFTIKVKANNFKTNIEKFVNVNGDWTIDDEVLTDSNTASNDFYMSADAVVKKESTMETDLSFNKGLVNLFFASATTDPFAQGGAYSVQFGPDNKEVRLFRFGGDTIATGQMPASISDDEYHHIKIEKTSNAVTVYVDGKNCLTHEFDNVEEFYNQGYAGVGLWDGQVNFKNLYVDKEEAAEPENPTKPTETPSTATTEKTDNTEKPKPDYSSATTEKTEATTEAKPTEATTAKSTETKKQPTYQKVSMRKIKVSWKKKSGAKGYVIYMKTGKGSYKKLKTVAKKTTSATISVKSGYSYKFKVKPIKNKTKKTYYKAYAAKAKNQGKVMKVTYRNISGYKGYTIYQKAGKGKYKAVKTTTKGGTITYTSKKVKVGTYYQYQIKGYKVVKGKKVYTTLKVKTVK